MLEGQQDSVHTLGGLLQVPGETYDRVLHSEVGEFLVDDFSEDISEKNDNLVYNKTRLEAKPEVDSNWEQFKAFVTGIA